MTLGNSIDTLLGELNAPQRVVYEEIVTRMQFESSPKRNRREVVVDLRHRRKLVLGNDDNFGNKDSPCDRRTEVEPRESIVVMDSQKISEAKKHTNVCVTSSVRSWLGDLASSQSEPKILKSFHNEATKSLFEKNCEEESEATTENEALQSKSLEFRVLPFHKIDHSQRDKNDMNEMTDYTNETYVSRLYRDTELYPRGGHAKNASCEVEKLQVWDDRRLLDILTEGNAMWDEERFLEHFNKHHGWCF